ncbi:BT4734/BF3469 family protein [Phnomibacter ginsenosidimutans]|uniref:VirE protein n=1 Tax=Phnomibacter ginsenosidimutans TaxID=2676868 RepID=A0A6I6G3Z7_9BACT|nr:BT4734/BF3469 family protein [Phnomibacter ginsenosidimutans]QGW26717.1 VirE protein [Phnomibacter ginsenosidimutans]
MIKDKAERDTKKALLPAITPSGTFSHRSDQSMLKHSGFICLDIDHKDNCNLQNFFELKSELSKIKQVAYCGLSVSGEGYFVLIPVAYPEKHHLHFQALLQLFTNFNIRLDQKCGNLSRLRGYSWDPEAYFNHAAIPFTGLPKPMAPAPNKPFSSYAKHQGNNQVLVEIILKHIESHCLDITADYNVWFSIGCNLASSFGHAGRSYYHRLSQFHSAYKPSETDRKFDECLKKAVTSQASLGTLINIAKSLGIMANYSP